MVPPGDRTARLAAQLLAQREAIQRYVLAIVRDPAAAEDLTQETLLRAHQKLASLDDPARLSSWLYRIATNLCRDRFRSAAYRRRPLPRGAGGEDASADGLPEVADDHTPRLDKALEQKEMSACVRQYVATLPDSYRAVILLHDAAGLTNPEIAEMLGLSLATVKIRVHRARARLRKVLDEACSFSTDERSVVICERKPPGPRR